MHVISVSLGERSYDVVVGCGVLGEVGELVKKAGLGGRRAAVVSDVTVGGIYGQRVLEALEKAGMAATLHLVTAGEGSKSMGMAERVCREMVREGHDRRSFVVALGGGVVGDLAGFVAGIFFRGIPFVQVPTTIVAQVDSSIGGKTGVNVAEGKNLVGVFHQPRLVVVDPEVLRSLPDREFFEGFGEVIKHAAIRDAGMVEELGALDVKGREVPADLIGRNIAIKARVVEADEHETLDIRALLNFGHTIGHGIEAAVPYGEMLHGEAISLGMRAALFLSERHGGLSAEETGKMIRLLERYHLPLVLPEEIRTETVLEKLGRDKKFVAGSIRFVVLEKLGSAKVTKAVTEKDLRDAIEYLRTPV